MEESTIKNEKVILIVDDEQELLMSLQRPLQTKYKVITTARSLDVMDLLSVEKVDCILLDIRMPGMTGIELLKEIKFKYAHIPVLIMTGHGDENDTITSLKYGASSYLKKPIDIYKLFEEITRVTTNKYQTTLTQKVANILFVDDETDFLSSLEKALSKFPYQTKMATSTDQAFALMEANNFDIIVVDIQMPGMTGLQFLERAKKMQNDFIPIVLTGTSSQELAIEALKQGAFDYIKKPLDIKDLISSIEHSMHKLGINREIQQKNTELMAKEKSLEALNDEIIMQKNYLENIVKSISNMLIITDKNGNIKTVNDATLRALGYRAEELVGQHLGVVLPDMNIDKIIHNLINEKGISNLEKEFSTKNKVRIYVLFSGSSIVGRDNNVDGFVFVAQDISQRKEAEEELHRLSYYDTLTNLPNRLYFEMIVKQTINSADKDKGLVALLYLDLDGFKSVNDRLGHLIGDELLKEVAKRLQNAFRSQDIIARIGGDEFVACLSTVKEKSDAGIVAQRLINIVNQPYYIENNEISVGASIGIALYPETAANFTQLFKNSDVALYKAKYAGRNQYQYFNKQLDIEYSRQLSLENALRFALGRKEFYMEYQPIYETSSNKIVAIEALARWKNQEHGSISPDIFIPLSEYNGLIIPIGEWILETTIRQFALWRGKGKEHLRLSLNISAYQIDRGEYLPEFLKAVCHKNNVPLSSIIIELTETAIMHNPKQSEKILNKFASLGCGIALDDFGQGYSSLSLLSHLPVSILKIDKKFIEDLQDKKNTHIVKSVINLSQCLSIEVIAEGVENQTQRDFLSQMVCDYMQGYYFCKPMSVDDMTKLLCDE